MTTLYLAPLSSSLHVTPRKWFMTPTGDYYTVVPLTTAKAQELVELGVRKVIIPTMDLDVEVTLILEKAGITISSPPTEEMCLTGS